MKCSSNACRPTIIATIGPASESVEVLRGLMHAGVGIFRLNMSHGSHAWHAEAVRRIRQVEHDLGMRVSILMDSKGPEMRVGKEMTEDKVLEEGEEVRLGKGGLSLTYPGLVQDVEIGDMLLIEGGEQEWRVEGKQGGGIVCRVVRGGTLTPARHVHVPGRAMRIESITKHDWEDFSFVCSLPVNYIALSFVRGAAEVKKVRAFLDERGRTDIHLVPKIETKRSLDNIDELLTVSNGIMIARGDLGAEMTLPQLPRLQRELIVKARHAGKPVIVATEMLESMTHQPVPTRAEVTDVYMAVTSQVDGVMTSGETASGRYPVRTIQVMGEIIEAAIADTPSLHVEWAHHLGLKEEIARMAVNLAEEAPDIRAILMVSEDEEIVRRVSQFRPICPVYVCSETEQELTQNQLLWGVGSLSIEREGQTAEAYRDAALKSLAGQMPDMKGARVLVLWGDCAEGLCTSEMPHMSLMRLG